MANYNAITGRKRRAARRDLPRKKRSSLSSTVASRMYAEQAMDECRSFLLAAQSLLVYLGIIFNMPNIDLQTNQEARDFVRLLLTSVFQLLLAATEMMKLDSELLDLEDDHEDNSGFNKRLEDITLDSFLNDDECDSKLRFKKAAITTIVNALPCPDPVILYYALPSPRYYKFKLESLVIYMLRKMSSARTHADLCDNEFGGSSARWGKGYNYIVKKFDATFARLIGPQGLAVWAPQFPEFAEHIREYIQRDKERTDRDGNQVIRGMPLQRIAPGDFNVFSVTDCTVYEISRPGSGPINNNNGAGRRQGWYIKQVSLPSGILVYTLSLTYFPCFLLQRAFYDGYHRGLEACVKILAIVLPNGMIGGLYGPTSGRQGDKTLLRMSHIDQYLFHLCQQHFGNVMYCTYGDDIFAGFWYCLRTRHNPAPGMPLTAIQEEENTNMKSVRECIEWAFAKAEQNWPLLNRKDGKKLEVDSALVWAEIRVMYLLTNFKVCELEGSTMTGTRGFRCPPPTLSQYLAM
jgi:DDE superfamily endonuclease